MEIIQPKHDQHPAASTEQPSSASPPPPQHDSGSFTPKLPGDSNLHHDVNQSRWRGVLSTITLFGSAFLIAILLNTFIIQSYQVDGQSMEPTLQNDDRLIVNKVARTISRIDGHQYVPHRGDIIIFNQDGLPGFIGQKQLIKRVIALPGERVVVQDGKITIFNSAHPNGFNPDTSTGYYISAPTTVGNVDITLQKDEIFVCGDNRGNSEDSRYFGPIKTNQVVAKLVLRILPLNKTSSF
jgi:signal peptidase I